MTGSGWGVRRLNRAEVLAPWNVACSGRGLGSAAGGMAARAWRGRRGTEEVWKAWILLGLEEKGLACDVGDDGHGI